MKNILFVVLSLAFVPYFASAEDAACRYGEFSGIHQATYVRNQSSKDDWYGMYNVINICKQVETDLTYVIVQEELVHDFKVINPPQKIISTLHSYDGLELTVEDRFDSDIKFLISWDGRDLSVVSKLAKAKLNRL